MKKILLSILLLIFFVPFIVNAETCDTSKISISSIKIEESSDNVTEIDEATASGKNINLNLAMSEVGDSINYKVVIKNDSNEDYELNKNSLNISSDYIDYVLESEDHSNIIKANSSKVVYLKVNYANEVPEEKFESGTFNDNIVMTLNLSSEDLTNEFKILDNPETGTQVQILFIVLIISTVLMVISKKKKGIKLIIVISSAVIIPISVQALCKYKISIESNVSITNANTFSGVIYRSSYTTKYNGDTINPDYIHCNNNNCYYMDENEYNSKTFSIKHEVRNNVIINSYACENKVCIKGGQDANFEENTQLFLSMYNGSNITDDRIYNSGNKNYIEKNGTVRLGSYCGSCIVQADNSSYCTNLNTTVC